MCSQSVQPKPKIPIVWLPRHNDVTYVGFRRGPTVAASLFKMDATNTGCRSAVRVLRPALVRPLKT
jgi:hypothetical protein